MNKFRRHWVKASTVFFLGSAFMHRSQAVGFVSESDPKAIAVGFRLNSSSVDGDKWKQFEPRQSCRTCALYKGLLSELNGPCLFFSGRWVPATGWCAQYEQVKR